MKQLENIYYTPDVLKAFDNVCYIAQVLRERDKNDRVQPGLKNVNSIKFIDQFDCRSMKIGNT